MSVAATGVAGEAETSSGRAAELEAELERLTQLVAKLEEDLLAADAGGGGGGERHKAGINGIVADGEAYYGSALPRGLLTSVLRRAAYSAVPTVAELHDAAQHATRLLTAGLDVRRARCQRPRGRRRRRQWRRRQ